MHWSKQEQNILLRWIVLTPPCPLRPCLLLKWRSSRRISSSLPSRWPWSPTSVTMPVLWVATGCPRSRRLPLRAESVLVLPTKDAMLYCGERNFEVLGFYIASTILTDLQWCWFSRYCIGCEDLMQCCWFNNSLFLLMLNVWAISLDLLPFGFLVTDWVIFPVWA